MSVSPTIGCSALQLSEAPANVREALDFEQLFARHSRFLHRGLRYLGVVDADLDDVLQEVFVVVHRRLHAFEGRSNVRTWLYGIAFRVASDYRKSAAVRRRKHELQDEALEAGPAVEASGHGRTEARDLLRKALAELDEDKRAVAVLYRLEGFTMPEVATILDCPVQTAYARWHAAEELLLRFMRRTERVRGKL